MSPIYVRPEREQAEHDRLIRFLQAKYSRKFEAVANPGDERVAPVKIATATHFPDLVLNDGKKLAGLVEIETAASVNNLETMAKWVPFSRARVPFHLYVPVPGYEAAMRLAEAHQVKAAEIWTYRPANEGFDLVRMFVDASVAKAAPAKAAPAAPPKPAPAPAVKKAAPAKAAAAAKRPAPKAKAARAPARPKAAAKKAKAPAARPKPSARASKAAAKNGKARKGAARKR